jgi:hypothetical protein
MLGYASVATDTAKKTARNTNAPLIVLSPLSHLVVGEAV